MGMDIIIKVIAKGTFGLEYVLVAIDYTKWVEATFYTRISSKHVGKFLIHDIICRHGVKHEL